jgi:hypothetical protein
MFHIGQQICLWGVKFSSNPGLIQVEKEILVTVVEEKTGVNYKGSTVCSSGQSIRGIDRDSGDIFEKHWHSWPDELFPFYLESQWNHEKGDKHLSLLLLEAVSVYNDIERHQQKGNTEFLLLGPDGNPIEPMGHVVKCEVHNLFSYQSKIWTDDPCARCRMEKKNTSNHWSSNLSAA